MEIIDDKLDFLDALATRKTYDHIGLRLFDEAVTAVIYSLGKENIDELFYYCKERLTHYPLLRYIDNIRKPKEKGIYKVNQFIKYKRNESISQLLKWFCEPKSGKRVYSRRELKERFITQTRKDQIKILKTFLLSSSERDREWAAQWANRDWSNSMTNPLLKAMEKNPSRNVCIAIIRNLPLEFVKKNAELFAEVAPADLCIRLGVSEKIDITKYNLNILEYLYCTSEIGYRIPESEAEIEQLLFAFLHKICAEYDYTKCLHPISIMTIPMIGKAIWGLGVHGMTEVLIHIIDFICYVYSDNRHLDWCEEFDRAVRWIQEKWEMDDKENFINMISTANIEYHNSREDERNSLPDESIPEFKSTIKYAGIDEKGIDRNLHDFINEFL